MKLKTKFVKIKMVALLAILALTSARVHAASSICNTCKQNAGCNLVGNNTCITSCDLDNLLNEADPIYASQQRRARNVEVANRACRDELMNRIDALLNLYGGTISQVDQSALEALRHNIDDGTVGVNNASEITSAKGIISRYESDLDSLFSTRNYQTVNVYNLETLQKLLPDYQPGGTYNGSRWRCVNGAWATNPYRVSCNAVFDISGNNGEACPSSQHYSQYACTATQSLDSSFVVKIPKLQRRRPNSAHCYVNPDTGRCVDTLFHSCVDATCYRCTNFKSCEDAAARALVYDSSCKNHGYIYDETDPSCNPQADQVIRTNCYSQDANGNLVDVGRTAVKNTVTNDIGNSYQCITRCSESCEELSAQPRFADAGIKLYNLAQNSCRSQKMNPVLVSPIDKYGLKVNCMTGCQDPCTKYWSDNRGSLGLYRWKLNEASDCQDNEIPQTQTLRNYYGDNVTCTTGCQDACKLIDPSLTAYEPSCPLEFAPEMQTVYSSALRHNISCYVGCTNNRDCVAGAAACSVSSGNGRVYAAYKKPVLAQLLRQRYRVAERTANYNNDRGTLKSIFYAGRDMQVTRAQTTCDYNYCPLLSCTPESGIPTSGSCANGKVASYAFYTDRCGGLHQYIKSCQNPRPTPGVVDVCKDRFGNEFTNYQYGDQYELTLDAATGYWKCQKTTCTPNPNPAVCQNDDDAGFGRYRSVCADDYCGPVYYSTHACQQPTCDAYGSEYKLGTDENLVAYQQCGQESEHSRRLGLGGVYQCSIGAAIPDDAYDVVDKIAPCSDGGLQCFRKLDCSESDPYHPDEYDPSVTATAANDKIFIPDFVGQKAGLNGYRCGRYLSVSQPGYMIDVSGISATADAANHSDYASQCGVSVTPSRFDISGTSNLNYQYFADRVDVSRLPECTDTGLALNEDGFYVCRMPAGSRSSDIPEALRHSDRNLVVLVDSGDFTIDTSIETENGYFKAFIVRDKMIVAGGLGTDPWARVDASGLGICPAPEQADLQGLFGAGQFEFESRQLEDSRLKPYVVNEPLYCDRQLVIAGSLAQWGAGNLELKRTFRGCVNASAYNSGNWHDDLQNAWTGVLANPSLYPDYNRVITPFVFFERADFNLSVPAWMKTTKIERLEVN